MGKAKLANLKECFQIVLLAPMRSFSKKNIYEMVKIMKQSFLVEQKFYLIWSFLVKQREYIARRL